MNCWLDGNCIAEISWTLYTISHNSSINFSVQSSPTFIESYLIRNRINYIPKAIGRCFCFLLILDVFVVCSLVKLFFSIYRIRKWFFLSFVDIAPFTMFLVSIFVISVKRLQISLAPNPAVIGNRQVVINMIRIFKQEQLYHFPIAGYFTCWLLQCCDR